MQNLKATLERKSLRHHAKLSDKKVTDQSYKKACDINNIVKQFNATGKLPTTNKVPQYGDYSEMPTLETAFAIAHNASKLFMELPSDIRKLINNDASQLENFISQPENEDLCLKYGLIEKKIPQIDNKPTPVQTEVTPTPKTEE